MEEGRFTRGKCVLQMLKSRKPIALRCTERQETSMILSPKLIWNNACHILTQITASWSQSAVPVHRKGPQVVSSFLPRLLPILSTPVEDRLILQQSCIN